MILVTGGAFQGKLEIAKTLWKQKDGRKAAQSAREPSVEDGSRAGFEQLCQADIICQFQLWIRCLLQEKKEPYTMIQQILLKNPHVVITLEQVGCGLVPMEAWERQYREAVGRAGCFLARQAEAVYVVNCGIPKKIK